MQNIFFLVLGLFLLVSCSSDDQSSQIIVPQEQSAVTLPADYSTPYQFGLYPQNANDQHVQTAYSAWKNAYLTEEGAPEGALRVRRPRNNDDTVSEGIAYGMLITAMMEDKEEFDQLYVYYNSFLDPNGLMNWQVTSNQLVVGHNAATDADVDIAYALLLAHRNFGDQEYLDEAKRLIGLIKTHMLEPGTLVLKPGDEFGGSDITNPSYFAVSYFKVFAEVMNDDDWNTATDVCYEILFKSWNETTGFVPDWCNVEGQTGFFNNYANGGAWFFFDAARTPWRMALDRMWYDDERARTYCNAIANFVQETGPTNIQGGYTLDASQSSNFQSRVFTSCMALGVLGADDQYFSLADQSYSASVTAGGSGYFDDTVRLICLLAQTGRYVKY